jgi:rod shape-determining protein MreC
LTNRCSGHFPSAGLEVWCLRIFPAAAGFLGSGGDFFLGWRKLRKENRALRDEVARLQREIEKREEEHQAYRRLTEALEFREHTGLEMIVASVIAHDSTNLFQTLLINKGRRDGVVKNAAVVTADGVVGITTQVYQGTSRILLMTDRSAGISALVKRTRDQGVLQGQGKGGSEMKYLSPQADIVVGDTIVTSGMAGVFPKGIRVGKVTGVRRGGYLLRKVEVQPAAALDRLEEVMVLERPPTVAAP